MTGRIQFTPEAEQQLHELDDRSGELVVNVIGIFSGGQSWESRVSPDQVPETS